MEAARSSKMLVPYNTTQGHNPEDLDFNHHLHESLKSCNKYIIYPWMLLTEYHSHINDHEPSSHPVDLFILTYNYWYYYYFMKNPSLI